MRDATIAALLVGLATPCLAHEDIDKCAHGHGDEAISNCTDLIKEFDHVVFAGNSPKLMWPIVSSFYSMRGAKYFERGSNDLALADFDTAIHKNPNNAVALNAACLVRMTLNKELDIAEADCNAALEVRPNWIEAMGDRGIVELRVGKVGDAMSDFETELANDPKSATGLFGRGIAKSRSGDAAGAKADIAAAIAIDPTVAATFAKYGITP